MNTNITPLLFHGITKNNPNSWEEVKKENFEYVLKIIGKEWLANPSNQNSNKRKWIITFDDGLESDYKTAYPLLLKYKIKGIFFLITDFIGKPNHLNWDQIGEMNENGMIFGSHGKSHKIMTKISHREARHELSYSKEKIETRIKKEINSFSFPYGYWNRDLIQTAEDVGYKYIYTSEYGEISGTKNYLPRYCINSSMNKNKIQSFLHPNKIDTLKMKTMHNSIKLAKNLIGNRNYKRLRNFIFR